MPSGLLVTFVVIAVLWLLCSLALAVSLRHDHPRSMKSRVKRLNAAGRSLFG